MTKEEAKIFILESAIEECHHTISFLHGCLTDSGFTYAYPDQTTSTLEYLEKLVPFKKLCFHSYDHGGCEACKERVEFFTKRAEALKVLEE